MRILGKLRFYVGICLMLFVGSIAIREGLFGELSLQQGFIALVVVAITNLVCAVLMGVTTSDGKNSVLEKIPKSNLLRIGALGVLIIAEFFIAVGMIINQHSGFIVVLILLCLVSGMIIDLVRNGRHIH